MGVPYRCDDSNPERSAADTLLADLGLTEASLAASQKAGRGDNSRGLTGPLGDSGPVSGNPMQITAPLPRFVQPDTGAPDASKIAAVPVPNLNAMKVVAAPNYIQPNVITPASCAGTSPTVKN